MPIKCKTIFFTYTLFNCTEDKIENTSSSRFLHYAYVVGVFAKWFIFVNS